MWLCMDRHLQPTPCHPKAVAAMELRRGSRCAHLRMPPLGRRLSWLGKLLGSDQGFLLAVLQNLRGLLL